MTKDERRSDDPPPVQPVGKLLGEIADDLKTIAKAEVELVKSEVTTLAKDAAINGAIIMLGGFVALMGLGFLCTMVVVALEPVIPQLWLRLLLSAVAYLGLGGALVAIFAKKMKKDVEPDLATPVREAKQTVKAVKDGVTD